VRRERRVPRALQDLQHRLLDEAVERRGDGDLKLHLPQCTFGFGV